MHVYIGADHRGFPLKETLKKYLAAEPHEIEDVGAFELDPNDDYTVCAEKVAVHVSQTAHSRGILLCGSGVGVEVVANKIDGVRAGIGISPEQVTAGRSHDDMNVLVIAADFVNEAMAIKMLHSFLQTPFDDKPAHQRRLDSIEEIEENN